MAYLGESLSGTAQASMLIHIIWVGDVAKNADFDSEGLG